MRYFSMKWVSAGRLAGAKVRRTSHEGGSVNSLLAAYQECCLRRFVLVQTWVARLRDSQRGQGLVEYSLILALIAIMTIVALRFLQPTISNTLNRVSSNL